MFWKNNSDNNKKTETPKMFKAPSDSRSAFRVSPPPDEPLMLKVGGQNIAIIDISSGGISFDSVKLKLGSIHPVQLTLPGEIIPIFAVIEILRIEDKKLCRAKLYDLTREQEDKIHQYVLNRQKHDLEKEKLTQRNPSG